MKRTKICFLLPGKIDKPVGGHKIIYEYANRLSADGYEVSVINNIFIPSKLNAALEFLRYIHGILRMIFRWCCQKNTCQKWFHLNADIQEKTIWSFSKRWMPQSDIYIATAAVIAHYLEEYDIEENNKVYFIQGYENWNLTEDELKKTYHINCKKIVVSKWLGDILKREGVDFSIVPNGFDFTEYHCDISITNKNKHTISMLFHKHFSKNCDMGFRALDIVKRQIPELHVNLFGVYEAPPNLPDWYSYYKSPDNSIHNRINNESAIYIAPSSIEGWGLTVGEAMMCGQAVACTDTKGYLEMAVDGVNALVSPINDEKALADNIIRLILDDELRYRIAGNGLKDIASFSIENSYCNFKKVLLSISNSSIS